MKIYIRNVSTLIYYDENGRIFLQDRHGVSKTGEEWGFFGGGIEQGESPKEAMLRESLEELSIMPVKYKYIGEYENDYFNELSGKNMRIHRFIFIASYNGEKFFIKEGRKGKWFSFDEAYKLKMVSGDLNELKMIQKAINEKT